ncbi:hypothetical protein FRC00_007903 [Tulasnella sp. 408]|nr:hypothetical protein FRC00_007903 [Tulasnella sp. 408]
MPEAPTRQEAEFGCYLLPCPSQFDISTLYDPNLDADIDVTVESSGFVVGDETDTEGASSGTPSAFPVDSLPVDTPAATLQDRANVENTSAQRRNRDKKRKRREQDADREPAARRRIHFLARATLLKSEDYVVRNGRRAKSGYVGIVDRGLDFTFLDGPAARRIRCLLQHQYELLEFDKLPAEYPICDSKGKIFAVVLGWPEGWAHRTEGANRAMERLQAALAGCKAPPNRRGPFAAHAVGYSYGGGQTEPMPFKRTKREKDAIGEFLGDPDVEAVFKYVGGRVTVCLPHRDSPNDAAGVCLDWVLGCFDVQKGGQLVLHEAQKILSLEPGRVILFPSAIITHETIPIAEGEWRSGVTGYAAGGLWRYMAQGFMTRGTWEMTGSEEALRQHDAEGEERWKVGLARFKTLPELIDWWTKVAAAAAARTEPSDVHNADLPL